MLPVHVELPATGFSHVEEFLVDSSAGNTVLNARPLGIDPRTLGPRYKGGISGIGGTIDAWIVASAVLRLQSDVGMITDVTPRLLLAISDEFAPHLLGRSVLIERRLKMVFDPARRDFYLRR
jgi:hypothetical protein